MGAIGGVATGYATDRYIFKSSSYTMGEGITDASLGVFGGGFARPVARIAWRGRGAVGSTYRIGKQTASKYGLMSRQFVADTAYAGLYFGERTMRGNVRPIAKGMTFVGVGRGVDHFRQSRARSHRSPNSTATRDTRITKTAKVDRRTPSSGGKCPPGFYWSWKDNACMPTKYA